MPIATEKRTWGRWYLEGNCLQIDEAPGVPYWIKFDSCQSETAREQWFAHLAKKNWIHESDLYLLAQAFKHLVDAGILQK